MGFPVLAPKDAKHKVICRIEDRRDISILITDCPSIDDLWHINLGFPDNSSTTRHFVINTKYSQEELVKWVLEHLINEYSLYLVQEVEEFKASGRQLN